MNFDRKEMRFFSLLLGIVCFFGNRAQCQEKFSVNIAVENLKRPARAIMTVRQDGNWKEYSADSKDNVIQLVGSVSEPSFAYLVMKYADELDRPPRLGNITQLYIENLRITVQTKDSLSVATIKGSSQQRDLESLNTTLAALPKASNTDAREMAIKKFVRDHPDSYVSIYALENISPTNSFIVEAHRVEESFKSLSMKIRSSASGRELERDVDISRNTAIGAIAPDFSQMDTTNQLVKLSSLRGRYVLVDFWASWCKPCRVENPRLVKTYQAFKDRNFTVIGVSLDNNRKSWVRAINKDQLTWTHVSDLKFWRNAVALQYGVKTVPQNYLLDPDGKIVARNIPIEKLAEELNRILR